MKDEINAVWSYSVCMPETIEKVIQHVTSDRHLTIRGLSSRLNISNEVITQILAKDLFSGGSECVEDEAFAG